MNKDNLLYCINLKKNNDRRNVMEKQFKKYKINYLFCDAVDAAQLIFTKDSLYKNKEERSGYYDFSKKERIYFNISSARYFQEVKSNGHIGCSLSHLYYINNAFKNNVNNLLMCEDDISFEYVNKWTKSIDQIIKDAPKDWNIIKLHCSNIKVLNNFKKEEYFKIPNGNIHFWSTGLYLISKNGMKSLLNKFYKNDNTYNLLCKYPAADYLLQQIDNVYYYSIPLVKNNNNDFSFKSDIRESNVHDIQEKNGIKFVEEYYS